MWEHSQERHREPVAQPKYQHLAEPKFQFRTKPELQFCAKPERDGDADCRAIDFQRHYTTAHCTPEQPVRAK